MQRSWIIGVVTAAGVAFGMGCQDQRASDTPAAQPPAPQQEEQAGRIGSAEEQPQGSSEGALGGSGASAAQGQGERQQQMEQTVVGRVASASEDELIVQDTYKKAHRLELTDETQIIGTGTGLSAQPKLLQGIDVRVSYSVEGENQVATKVEVLRADTGQQGQQPQQQ